MRSVVDRLTLLDVGLRALDARLPDVTPSLCLVTRYRGSSCRRCLDACPGAAITSEEWLSVTPDLCSSCGACAAVCRTGALSFAGRSAALRAALAAAAAGEPGVALVCGPAWPAFAAVGTDVRVVVVPCLGGVAAADLVAAAALGVAAVELVTGRCEDCSQAPAGDCLHVALEDARATLAALGVTAAFSRRAGAGTFAADDRVATGAAAGDAALSRHELFSFLARGMRRAVAEATAPAQRGVEDLHRQAPPPSAHERLIDDLAALRRANTAAAVALPGALPLATLAIGVGCDGCGLCVRYCPHAALTLADGRAAWDAAACTGCGLCVEVCPPTALELGPAVLAPVAL